jgi:1,4-alpha-glucan branching enzyme
MHQAASKGWFVGVLHLHIPFVFQSDPMAEEWLYQATAESYIPLLNIINRLVAQGRSPRLTLGVTPPLAEQLSSDQFRESFIAYLRRKMQSAFNDALSFRNSEPEISFLARRWEEYYWSILYSFEKFLNQDIIGALRRLQEQRHIEVITSSATHAFMPLLSRPSSIRAQIGVGVETYERRFGQRPVGFWLPECAYRPGLEDYLEQEGIRFFIIDSRQLNGGACNGHRTPFRPHLLRTSRGTNLMVLSRNFEMCSQVWDHSIGYPGDPHYLDFHKKHLPSGLRYWRVTDRNLDMSQKQVYRVDTAFDDRKEEHARHYCEMLARALEDNYGRVGRPEGIVTAFDAELFGHWWFEGVEWLCSLIERIHANPNIGMATASEFIERTPADPDVRIVESSWSDIGAHENWLRGDARDMWEVIHACEQNMERLSCTYSKFSQSELGAAILTQAAREMLLLQSSDWLFMLTTGNTPNIALEQIKKHCEHFDTLLNLARRYCAEGKLPPDLCSVLQRYHMEDWIFPEVKMEFWQAA